MPSKLPEKRDHEAIERKLHWARALIEAALIDSNASMFSHPDSGELFIQSNTGPERVTYKNLEI